jgi:hypothetical protein
MFVNLPKLNYSLTNSLIHMYELGLVSRTNKSFFLVTFQSMCMIPSPTAVRGLTHVWFCDPQQYGDYHAIDSVIQRSKGNETRLILRPTAVWGLTDFFSETHSSMGTDRLFFWDPQQYGDWLTFDSVTHSSMGTDRLFSETHSSMGTDRLFFWDPQQYGDWHTFDSVTHSSMGTDRRLILWPTAVRGLTQYDDSIIDMILGDYIFILSHSFEIPSQNCRSTSTMPCGFFSKPTQLRQKQQTSNYWYPLNHVTSHFLITFF